MVSEQFFRWLLPDFHTAVSPNLSALRGRCLQAAPVYFPHTLSPQQTLLKAGWPCHWWWRPLHQELTVCFLFCCILQTLIIQKNKFKTPAQQLNTLLVWESPVFSRKGLLAKAAPAPPPPFAPRSSILMTLSSHWSHFLPNCDKPTRWSWLIAPKSFIANNGTASGAILEVPITSKIWWGLS